MQVSLNLDLADVRRLKSAMDTYRGTLVRRLPTGEPMPVGVICLIEKIDAAEKEFLAQAESELDALLGSDHVPVRE